MLHAAGERSSDETLSHIPFIIIAAVMLHLLINRRTGFGTFMGQRPIRISNSQMTPHACHDQIVCLEQWGVQS